MNKNTFCIKRSYLFLSLIFIVFLFFFALVNRVNNNSITLNNKAAEPPFKVYFAVGESSSVSDLLFNGLTDLTVDARVYLKPQRKYYICIYNNSSDFDIRALTINGDNKKLFNLNAPGANIYGYFSDAPGCWEFSYDRSGDYEITGVFTPTIDGKQQVLIPPKLNVTVGPKKRDLRAYFEIGEIDYKNYMPKYKLFDGLIDPINEVILAPQKKYYICIHNNSVFADYNTGIFSNNKKLFTLNAPGAKIFGNLLDSVGCWEFSYERLGNYEITGIYRLTINGKQQLLIPPKLNVAVREPQKDLKAYFEVSEYPISESKVPSIPNVFHNEKLFYGLTNKLNKITLFSQKTYYICLKNNSIDQKIRSLYSTGDNEDLFYFEDKDDIFIAYVTETDYFPGCRMFSYERSGDYSISGAFAPKIEGKQVILRAPVLDVTVK